MHCLHHLWILWLVAAILPASANGRNVLFNRLDVNNGLPSNEVSCIYKDRKGFMWFGTSAGIARFDGYEFRTSRHEVGNVPFSEEYILQITETTGGNLWITYQDGKVSVFDPRLNTFCTPEEVAGGLNIRQVFHDAGGRLLYETDRGDLCLYDYETNRVDSFAIQRTDGGLGDVVLQNHRLYVIHASGLLEILDAASNTPIAASTHLETYPEVRRFSLFVDSDGEVWVYMHPENADGLFRFRPAQDEWIHYTTASSPQALTSLLIRDVEEDPQGMIWIATDHGGLNLLDKKTGQITPLRNHPFDYRSESQNSVICLYRDDTGILWCGTYKNGVSYYHESIFKFGTIRYPVTDMTQAGINDFNCVHEDPSGNLWIGTNGHGLLYYERNSGRFRQYRHDPSDPHSLASNIVVCLAGDRQGRLWIGTYMGGLDCFANGRFVHYSGGDDGALSNASVYSLYPEDDRLWIGTLGKGLNLLHTATGQWSRFTASDSVHPLLSDNVYAIARGRDSQLLVGTAVGVNLVCTRSREVRTFDGTKDGRVAFRDKGINTTFIDSRGLLWIGSNNGLSVYDRTNDRLSRLDRSSGLPDNAVMSIIEDDSHILWLGTKNGLLKIHPRYCVEESRYDFVCTPYYEDEGVQGRIFNRNSVCRTSSGELILGGTAGLTVFNPLQIRYNDNPPGVVVSGFDHGILRRDISYESSLSLDYDQRNFTLTVSVLNYFLPSKSRFSCKMEGFDRDWIPGGPTGRHVTYANLPPGDYTFMVRAENNDGMPGPNLAALRISVAPPVWLTPWAFLVYAVVAACFVYFTFKVVTNIQRREFAKKQEQLAAGQLHEMDEMKLRFFTNVSHEFRTPLTLIMAPLEKLMKSEANPGRSAMLALIHENASQLLTLVNQLLDFRKIDVRGGVRLQLSSGDIVLFIRNMVYSFKDMSEQKNIRLSFSSTFPSLIMSFDTDKVFRIASNLISNAFKFTPEGGEITVYLRLEKHEDGQMSFLVEVADTGIGIAPGDLELIFNRFYQAPSPGGNNKGTGIGLHICREYARVHNGSITVKSEPGRGSVFCLSLPFNAENIHEVVSAPSPAPEPDGSGAVKAVNAPNRPSLLVVDDHTSFRLFMQNSLSDTYNVTTAPDGEEAWKIILGELPDIVVADWMMPLMDGLELCRQIKNDVRTSHIPVILLTSRSAGTGKIDGLEAGADDYIEKPFSLEILQLRMARIIEYKEKMQRHFFRSVQRSIPLTGDVQVSSLDDELIRKTIRFIEEQMTNPSLSVEWLSREMAMSRTNFYKKILAITGKTPLELIRTVRMKYAAQLLENDRMHVGEAALRVGVNDNKLFRKYFKEEFGILPSELHRKKTP
jgi:signal transduction histidine kinase/ligand-binding sensor domain-containing protein/DNA-binding response OmpR family regulator